MQALRLKEMRGFIPTPLPDLNVAMRGGLSFGTITEVRTPYAGKDKKEKERTPAHDFYAFLLACLLFFY